jgi:hypothetical protein
MSTPLIHSLLNTLCFTCEVLFWYQNTNFIDLNIISHKVRLASLLLWNPFFRTAPKMTQMWS